MQLSEGNSINGHLLVEKRYRGFNDQVNNSILFFCLFVCFVLLFFFFFFHLDAVGRKICPPITPRIFTLIRYPIMFNLLLLLFYYNFIFTCAMVTNFDPCRVASSSSRLRILIASSTAGVFFARSRTCI